MIARHTLVGLLAVAGCQPSNTSETKALDNFAGGNAVHQCSGGYTSNASYMAHVKGGSASARAAVEESLSALPPNVKDLVFAKNEVSVELTPDVTELCLGSQIAAAYRNKESQPFLSCHQPRNGRYVIYASDKPKDIKRGLVRAMAYYITDVGLRLEERDGKVILEAVEERDVLIQKDMLALAFLSDVAASSKYSLQTFAGMVDRRVLAAESDGARAKAWFALNGLQAVARKQFSDFVYAEAMDSFHCSNSTRSTLLTDFPNTAAMLGLRQSRMNLSEGDADEGMSLWGARSRRRARFSTPFQATASTQQSSAKPAASATPIYQMTSGEARYFNPNSYQSYSDAELKSLASSYGQQSAAEFATVSGAIKFDPASGTYSNYPDGARFVRSQDGTFAHHDASGAATGYIVRFDPKADKWVTVAGQKPVKGQQTQTKPAQQGASDSPSAFQQQRVAEQVDALSDAQLLKSLTESSNLPLRAKASYQMTDLQQIGQPAEPKLERSPTSFGGPPTSTVVAEIPQLSTTPAETVSLEPSNMTLGRQVPAGGLQPAGSPNLIVE